MSRGALLSIAMRAIPAMGSQHSAVNLSMTSRVRLSRPPRWRPPRRSPGLDPPPAMRDQWLPFVTLAGKCRGVQSSALVSIGFARNRIPVGAIEGLSIGSCGHSAAAGTDFTTSTSVSENVGA
jgi:hypothetical protein